MIKVILYRKSDKIIGFAVSGHANYDEYGKDIVCASVSMLAINTANAIKKFTNDTLECVQKDDTGFLSVLLQSKVSNESKLLLDAFKLGITSVKNEYGNDYINIEYREV